MPAALKSSPEIPQRGIWNPATGLRWGGLALLLTLPWFMDHGLAGVSIFLKLDNGKIAGESLNTNHKGEIDLLSMSFGGSNSGTTHLGSLGGGGKSSVNDIRLFKYNDKSTPELIRRVMTGQPIGEAQIAFVESGLKTGERPVVTISLNNILVTSHTSGGSGAEDRLTESFTLNFAEYTYQTFSYSSSGEQTDSPSMTWNIAQNTGGTGGANTAPSITSIANQVTAEDTAVTTSFTLADSQTATGALTLARSTSDPFVVPLSGITFGGSGSSRTVIINPAANASGSAIVTVTVTDAGGLSASRSFTVTVNPVNDPPTIQAIGNQIINQDTAHVVTLNVSDIDTTAANVSITRVSGNSALIPASNITFSGSGASTRMTLNPVPGASGSALITLTANDGALNSPPISFTLTVNAVASGPTDIQLSPLAVSEQSPTNTVVGSLTASDPDDGNNVTFSLTDSAGGRFKLGGAGLSQVQVDNGRLLDFETASSHAITVRATDPDLNTFDKVFTISVANINEAPIITSSSIPSFTTDTTTPIIGLGVSDPDSGGSNVTVTLQVSGGILQLDSSGSLAGKIAGNSTNLVTVTAPVTAIAATLAADGLTYSTNGLSPGVFPLTIQANDLGNTGSGGAQSASTSLDLTVIDTPLNQWRRLHFDATQLSNPAISGMLADADKDGVGNLLEYGVGSDPLDPADGPGLVEFIEEVVAGVKFPAVRFNRLKQDFDPALQIQLEIATDNFNWRIDPEDSVQVSTTQFDSTRDTVVIRSSQSLGEHTRQMMRLRFTLEP